MKQIYIFLILFGFLMSGQLWWLLAHFQKRRTFSKNKKEGIIGAENKFRFLSNFGRRLKISWILFFISIVSFSLGHVGITILFFFISFLAFREFISIMHLRTSDYWSIFCSFYIFLPLQYFFVLTNVEFLSYIFLPVYVFLLSPMLSISGQDSENFFERAAKFQWAQIACIYCLSYAPSIAYMKLNKGEFSSSSLLLYLLAVVFASDAFQYITGHKFGKKKIAPTLSPNKTWEGTIFGILISSSLGCLLYWLTPFTWWQSFLISFVLSVVGFLGGLVMSGIKRSLKIKDWGDLLGAHGGVLDRFDSFVFTAPLFYHLCKYFFE